MFLLLSLSLRLSLSCPSAHLTLLLSCLRWWQILLSVLSHLSRKPPLLFAPSIFGVISLSLSSWDAPFQASICSLCAFISLRQNDPQIYTTSQKQSQNFAPTVQGLLTPNGMNVLQYQLPFHWESFPFLEPGCNNFLAFSLWGIRETETVLLGRDWCWPSVSPNGFQWGSVLGRVKVRQLPVHRVGEKGCIPNCISAQGCYIKVGKNYLKNILQTITHSPAITILQFAQSKSSLQCEMTIIHSLKD